jgi:hypothetical protein
MICERMIIYLINIYLGVTLSPIYTKEFEANVQLKSSIPIGAKVEINTLDVVSNVNLEIDNQKIIVSIITLNINHKKIQQFHTKFFNLIFKNNE